MVSKDNKKKNKLPARSQKVIVILSTLLITSFIGTATSTYAWFEYTARAGLNYHGAAVGESNTLDIGFYSEKELENYEIYGLVRDNIDPNIYWSRSNISKETIAYFCEIQGYSFRTLKPTTSGSFEEGKDFSLKPAPSLNQNYLPTLRAEKSNYLTLPLVFKPSAGTLVGTGDQSIILTASKADGSGNINKAMRMHVQPIDVDLPNFIYNPMATDKGFDFVGGVLDLNLDGFYDYNEANKKEYFYGEAESLTYKDEVCTNKEPLDVSKRSTFNSAHMYGMHEVDFSKTILKSANYLGTKDVLATKELTKTKTIGNRKIARVDLTIYVEGWANQVIDSEAFNFFSLDLEFELQEF